MLKSAIKKVDNIPIMGLYQTQTNSGISRANFTDDVLTLCIQFKAAESLFTATPTASIAVTCREVLPREFVSYAIEIVFFRLLLAFGRAVAIHGARQSSRRIQSSGEPAASSISTVEARKTEENGRYCLLN